MSKKLLSVVLALALVFSCFAVGAFALGSIGYESEEDAPNYTQAWALESTDNNNGTYTVKVKLTANYGVGSIQFKVLKTVNAGTIKLTAATEGEDIPENWVADVSFSDTTGEVAVIPHPNEDGVYAVDATDGIYVAELTYTVSNDANGSLVIDVADAKSESNPGGTLIAARMSDGNVVTGTSITGQTVSQNTNTVTIGSASTPPTLAVVDGTIGVIDTSRTEMDAEDIDSDGDTKAVTGYIYGVEPEDGQSVYDVFEVVGDGEMVVVPNAEGNESATGAIVQVVDLDGNVVAEYVLIIFGDVNGDGAVDSNDANNLEQHENYELGDYGRLESYLDFAGDVNCDGGSDSNDANNIEQHENYELGENSRIYQADIIAGL